MTTEQEIEAIKKKIKRLKIWNVVLVILVLLIGWWQCATWRYLRNEMRPKVNTLIEKSCGGPCDPPGYVPKPPPKI